MLEAGYSRLSYPSWNGKRVNWCYGLIVDHDAHYVTVLHKHWREADEAEAYANRVIRRYERLKAINGNGED